MRANGTVSTVRSFIEEHDLLKKGESVVVALSGGADSVCLLHILISLKEEYDLKLAAAHFNHGIRGAEADRDMAFVQSLCKRWDVPLYGETANVPEVAATLGESVETCGRRMRYRFFDDVLRNRRGGKLATAHHRDDSMETMLWNLTRGSGLAGLGGIPVRRDSIIRPLLCLSRREIEDYCRENALEYVTDSTNLSDDYTRNRLRHQVIPVLRELNPALDDGMERTASLMREADEYFDHISKSELNKAKTENGYTCEKLLRLEPIVLRYAVKTVLENAEAPLDYAHITLITEAMRTGGAVELGRGFTASCAQGVLRVYAQKDTRPEDGDFSLPFTEYIKTHGTRIAVRDGRLDLTVSGIPYTSEEGAKINNLFLKHCIPCDIITENTVFRYRRAGDTFTDARRGVTKSLKKLMNELKIPREIRDTIPVIAEGSTILWLQGYGTSAQARVDLTRDGELIFIGG